MSIFDNVVFDEFTLLEGKQAEEYKKRKAKEAEKAEREENKKFSDRVVRRTSYAIANGNSGSKEDADEKLEDDIMKHTGRIMASSKTGRKHVGKMMTLDQNDPKNLPKSVKQDGMRSARAVGYAVDAIDRHDRKMAKRKGVKESAFDDVEMI